MLEGIEILDVITVLALSLVVVSLALVWVIRTAWGLMCNLRDEETEHARTRRRLEDVEAIRREPHLQAVEAGGCAPWIMIKSKAELEAERMVDRAFADAGIMPVADYVAKHGAEPHQ